MSVCVCVCVSMCSQSKHNPHASLNLAYSGGSIIDESIIWNGEFILGVDESIVVYQLIITVLYNVSQTTIRGAY